jgi:hypothetical protein
LANNVVACVHEFLRIRNHRTNNEPINKICLDGRLEDRRKWFPPYRFREVATNAIQHIGALYSSPHEGDCLEHA